MVMGHLGKRKLTLEVIDRVGRSEKREVFK